MWIYLQGSQGSGRLNATWRGRRPEMEVVVLLQFVYFTVSIGVFAKHDKPAIPNQENLNINCFLWLCRHQGCLFPCHILISSLGEIHTLSYE